MKLSRIECEFSAIELAELAAGRVRRNVAGIKRVMLQPIGRAAEHGNGKERYTMLPANMRMQNYATAVMVSDISDDVLPEPMYRKNVRLVLLCENTAAGRAAAILMAAGAEKMQKIL